MRRDADIQRDVLSDLDWDPEVDAAEIGVTVADGVVTLAGRVGNYAVKRAAERAAQRVLGVTAIAEDMVIDLTDRTSRSDLATDRHLPGRSARGKTPNTKHHFAL